MRGGLSLSAGPGQPRQAHPRPGRLAGVLGAPRAGGCASVALGGNGAGGRELRQRWRPWVGLRSHPPRGSPLGLQERIEKGD